MPVSSVKFDATEVAALAEFLARAPGVAAAAVKPTVARGAYQIKTDAKSRVTGLRHLPAYPSSITYDMHTTESAVWAEIGPDKNRRQGALGNIVEYGSPTSAPRPHMAPAAEAELPKFAAVIEGIAAKATGLG
jgi:hypothetical protein